jgi:hypothetical protein
MEIVAKSKTSYLFFMELISFAPLFLKVEKVEKVEKVDDNIYFTKIFS